MAAGRRAGDRDGHLLGKNPQGFLSGRDINRMFF